MRTITFNIDGGDGIQAIGAMILGMPVGKQGIKFDREGPAFTSVNHREADSWVVSFRPVGTDSSRSRRYRNPVDAAQAVLDRKHNEHGALAWPVPFCDRSHEFIPQPGGVVTEVRESTTFATDVRCPECGREFDRLVVRDSDGWMYLPRHGRQ